MLSATVATAVELGGGGDHGWLTQITPVKATSVQNAQGPTRSMGRVHRT
jgi:hypothetical protein